MDTFTTFDHGPTQSPIARHLSKNDLYNCVRVSKAFRDIYLPALWHSLNLDELLDFLHKAPIHLEHFTSGLWRNGSLVRVLTCETADDSNLLPLFLEMVVAPSCRHLKHIILAIPEQERHKGWHRALFKGNSRSLIGFSLDIAEHSMDLISSYLSWSRFPHLQELLLHMEGHCDLDSLVKIIDRCPGLTTLMLTGLEEVVQGPSFAYGPLEPYHPTGIKCLGVDGAASADILLCLLASCPKLTHLYITGCIGHPGTTNLPPGLEACDMSVALGTAPTSLRHLIYTGHPHCNNASSGERDVLTILVSLSHVPLEELHIIDASCGRDSFIMIDELFSASLRSVFICSLMSTTTETVRDLLVHGKNLISFELSYPGPHTDHIDAWELVRQPWGCTKLQSLMLPIGHDSKFTIYRKKNGNSDPLQILLTLDPQMRQLRHIRNTALACLCGKTVLSEFFAARRKRK
ncbi:hypothetical protein DFQ27_003138 [Actinomortierella ambigua]|uniref:F-box domain-containing protein n=1 Tax=Actinomortierella ambigua TaxID=1343610 RepID=A0A9P6Q7D9_9FUNG|nr:hypothetical protein DFQ27_003138 [Actinomortierella ambigua]